MLRQLAALTAAALLTTTLTAVQPAAAATTSCTKTVLPLPADAVPAGSMVRTADPSGRYLLGFASDSERASQGVLWVDGVPRWLASRPGGYTTAYAVTEGGFVLGTTATASDVEYWIYSAPTDSYRILQVPENFDISGLVDMNVHQDIVGNAWDETRSSTLPFVWPVDGQPRLLPRPAGVTAGYVADIADDGRILGQLGKLDGTPFRNYLWPSRNRRPARLSTPDQPGVWARTLEGSRIGGGFGAETGSRGLLWNTRTGRYTELEDGVADLNPSGDLVTYGGNIIDRWPSVLIRSDGTRTTFPAETYFWHIFNRGNPAATAAGYEVVDTHPQAITYKCSS